MNMLRTGDLAQRVTKMTMHALPMIAAAALLAGLAAPASAQNLTRPPFDLSQDAQDASRIVGGEEAKPDAYPFQVMMLVAATKQGREWEGRYCGGTLIRNTIVLTSAYCVTTNAKAKFSIIDPSQIVVSVGSIERQQGERIRVTEIVRHPAYDPILRINDVAILKLEQAPKTDSQAAPVRLPDATALASLTRDGAAVTALGWGQMENKQEPTRLRAASVELVDRKACNERLMASRMETIEKKYVKDIIDVLRVDEKGAQAIRDLIRRRAKAPADETMLCAGKPAPVPQGAAETYSCVGDNGGPLLSVGADGKPVQVGLFSTTDPECSDPQALRLYVNVGKFRQWIDETIR